MIKARTKSKLPVWFITAVVWLALKLFDMVGLHVTGFDPE